MARLSQIALATPDIAWVKVKRRDPRTGDYVRNDDGTPKLFDQMVVNLHTPSSKITAVKELIKDHDEKQFVLFSASKKACYLAQQDFATARITSEVLSGDTPQSQREGMVKRFTGGDYQVFVGVIEAAGEGIDGLQHATDTAIFLDRSWRTIKNMQAEDRLDRDGQERGVQIIDVIARNTLDLGRLQKLETKWSWIKETLDNPTDAQARFIAEGYGH